MHIYPIGTALRTLKLNSFEGWMINMGQVWSFPLIYVIQTLQWLVIE